MRVGVIADTTYPLPRGLAGALGVPEAIVHAGGIGDSRVIEELGALAPLTAVVSHRDFLAWGDRFPETAEIVAAGARILVTHLIGTPPDLLGPLRQRLENDPPDVIVHGHGNAAQVLWIGGTLFFNPGSATRGKAGHPPTCGLLEVEGPGRITAHVLEIPA